jgi:hypothetical protein
MFIPDPDFFPIPDPDRGSMGQEGPGPGSQIRNTDANTEYAQNDVCNGDKKTFYGNYI